MNICPFIIHVLDAVLGPIVLNTRPRHLASPPARLPAGEALSRRGLAEDPPVELGADAVIVEAVGSARAVRRQFGQPRPKTGIDVALQNLGGGGDVGNGG